MFLGVKIPEVVPASVICEFQVDLEHTKLRISHLKETGPAKIAQTVQNMSGVVAIALRVILLDRKNQDGTPSHQNRR